MQITKERKGLLVKPERLAVLRSIWAEAGIEGILDHQVREKLQSELSKRSRTTLIRVGNPGPLFHFPRPYIVAELGFSHEHDDWDVDSKHWEVKNSLTTPVYRMLLDENWLYGNYLNQGETKLVRPELAGNHRSVWSLVDQHIDRARKVSFG